VIGIGCCKETTNDYDIGVDKCFHRGIRAIRQPHEGSIKCYNITLSHVDKEKPHGLNHGVISRFTRGGHVTG
jgi:hypothetical protein